MAQLETRGHWLCPFLHRNNNMNWLSSVWLWVLYGIQSVRPPIVEVCAISKSDNREPSDVQTNELSITGQDDSVNYRSDVYTLCFSRVGLPQPLARRCAREPVSSAAPFGRLRPSGVCYYCLCVKPSTIRLNVNIHCPKLEQGPKQIGLQRGNGQR
jgi:hypothetical protein